VRCAYFVVVFVRVFIATFEFSEVYAEAVRMFQIADAVDLTNICSIAVGVIIQIFVVGA